MGKFCGLSHALCSIHRDSHGKISFQNLAKLISARWRAATEEDKACFKQMEREDQIRHDRELAEWKRQSEGNSSPPVQPVALRPKSFHRRVTPTKTNNASCNDQKISLLSAGRLKPLDRPRKALQLPKATFAHDKKNVSLYDCFIPIVDNPRSLQTTMDPALGALEPLTRSDEMFGPFEAAPANSNSNHYQSNPYDCFAPIVSKTYRPKTTDDAFQELAKDLGDEGVDLVIRYFL